jgi:hypothetical protein
MTEAATSEDAGAAEWNIEALEDLRGRSSLVPDPLPGLSQP